MSPPDTKGSNDRTFRAPLSMAEAKERKRTLEREIRKHELDLADRERFDRSGNKLSPEDYKRWRRACRASLIHKTAEHTFLKDWIVERRRQVEAEKIGIFAHDDPKEILVGVRKGLRKAISGDDSDLGALYNTVDQYLQHVA